jgi:hypothetical protein
MPSYFLHRYNAQLYAPLRGRVELVRFQRKREDLLKELRTVQLFHMHWPELLFKTDPVPHLRLIELLEDANIPIIWTQHNLLPHRNDPAWNANYQLWADAAQGVIHHSQWGMEQALGFRAYREDAIHRVIPHAHWGSLIDPDVRYDKADLARDYGLTPGRTHLGILGAPRASKDLQLVVEGFLASGREDLDLAIFSLRPEDRLPEHPRIRTFTYKAVPRDEYNRRLALIDVLVLPFRRDAQMLTTGVVGDVIGASKAALISDWPYLIEMLGDSAIVYGNDAKGFAGALAALDTQTIERSAKLSGELRDTYPWERSAEETYQLLLDVLAANA